MSDLLRTSISLPSTTFAQLDQICHDRGFRNRSHALATLVARDYLSLIAEQGTSLMAGTLTLVLDEARPGLLNQLSAMVRRRIDEVIASLSIPLEDQHRMDVWVVQGPAPRLHELLQEVQALRGVVSSAFSLSPTVLPPIHERPRLRSTANQAQGKAV